VRKVVTPNCTIISHGEPMIAPLVLNHSYK
jgi:hypothetical protein